MVSAASIKPMTLSNHSPITLTLRYELRSTPTRVWRLPPSALAELEFVNHVKTCIREYFSLNRNSCSSPLMLWEAHKCVIRGEFMKIQTRLCKRNTQTTSALLTRIASLESQHKQSLAAEHLAALTEAREELLHLLNTKTKKSFMKRICLYY